MSKTIYLTFGDGISGVYHSQVIDVVKFLNIELGENITLVSIISIRNFLKVRKEIKTSLPKAMVIPMFPKLSNILKNKLTIKILYSFIKFDKVIARGPLATYLAQTALKNKNVKITYDGRGANKEEEREYNILAGALNYNDIEKYERSSVLNSDFRIAVSQELVKYWKQEFNYNSGKHVIIPCMLGVNFEDKKLDFDEITKKRRELGYTNKDIILIYSGSIAGWQSFEFLYNFLETNLQQNSSIKIMFLSKTHKVIDKLKTKFPNQVKRFWLSISEVYDYLSIGDYGILFREQAITNQVASPVKFAEYLSAGLSILISEDLGDFSNFVKTHDCGSIIDNNPRNINLIKLEFVSKLKNKQLAEMHFIKTTNINTDKYKRIF